MSRGLKENQESIGKEALSESFTGVNKISGKW